MKYVDESFVPDAGLERAVALLRDPLLGTAPLPSEFVEQGLGEHQTLELLAPHVLNKAAKLDSSVAFAHMDPPTPWITWATALWNARLNQNLLHPATSPFALEAENRVIDWLAPYFGMQSGHLCSGSTIANLTALWAARDAGKVTQVVASTAAHVSVEKAARILGLAYEKVPTTSDGRIDERQLGDLSSACLVVTAGTTSTGAIDSLDLIGRGAWNHVDAAWAGPLRLSPAYTHLLDGIQRADSVAISAHKWLFQPKDSALVLFRDAKTANAAISFGGGYLAVPNVGVQGSRGAAAIPLLATLMAWGKQGVAKRIERTMNMAQELAEQLEDTPGIELWGTPVTGVNVFRPLKSSTDELLQRLPEGMLSTCVVDGQTWLRSVAANPLADTEQITALIKEAVS